MVSRFLVSVLLGALALAGFGVPAQAHSLLVTPRPRDQQDGYKDPPRAPPGTGAPCGVGRTVPPQPETTYLPGQPLTVQWTETIDHPGCFVIDFAQAADSDFQILGVKSHTAASGSTPRSWSLDVVLPDTPCSDCTLRLRQLMLAANVPESACPPNPIPAGATYYSCSNLILSGGDGGAGTGGAGGGESGGAGSGAGGSSGDPNGSAGAVSSNTPAASGCSVASPPHSERGTGLGALVLCGALAAVRRRMARRRATSLRTRLSARGGLR